MSAELRNKPVAEVERVTVDDNTDLGYRAVAKKLYRIKNQLSPTPPRGGSSTAPPTTPPNLSSDRRKPSRNRMRVVGIQPLVGDHVEWQLTVPPEHEEQGASILFNLRVVDNPMRALQSVTRFNELAWLSPTPDSNEWVLDLDELRKYFPDYFPMSWCWGRVLVYPAYPTIDLVGTPRTGIEFRFDSSTVKI